MPQLKSPQACHGNASALDCIAGAGVAGKHTTQECGSRNNNNIVELANGKLVTEVLGKLNGQILGQLGYEAAGHTAQSSQSSKHHDDEADLRNDVTSRSSFKAHSDTSRSTDTEHATDTPLKEDDHFKSVAGVSEASAAVHVTGTLEKSEIKNGEEGAVCTTSSVDCNKVCATSCTTICCFPSGCPRATDRIIIGGGERKSTEAEEPVKVLCSNDACTVSGWMHASCFQLWEQQVLTYLRSCGRARSWSEKQRLQNLWSKKGYDLVYKVCPCKCERGHLRKDLDYFQISPTGTCGTSPQAKTEEKRSSIGKKNRRKFSDNVIVVGSGITSSAGVRSAGGYSASGSGTYQHASGGGASGRRSCAGGRGMNELYSPLRVRTTSSCSTGSSPPTSSDGTPPITPGGALTPGTGGVNLKLLPSQPLTPGGGTGNGLVNGGGGNHKFDFFSNAVQAAAGNIFNQRTDMEVFRCLPCLKRNTYQIKVEDEGQHGNDETRTFLMINLSVLRVTCMPCVVCDTSLPVYDKYPIIDGLFFLSPLSYFPPEQSVSVNQPNGWRGGTGNARQRSFLNAVCMHCLGGSAGSLNCVACHAAWPGSTFVIGTMYSYDVFAAMPCCSRRVQCKSCDRVILSANSQLYKSFSDYSKAIECPHCHVTDHHFVRPLSEIYRHFHPSVIVRPAHVLQHQQSV